MSGFQKVAMASAIPPGKDKKIEVGGKQIALFNNKGTFYAIDDRCSHRGGPLSEGELNGTTVTCPWHGASFDVRSGKVLGGPTGQNQGCYQVRLEGQEVQLDGTPR